MTYLEPELTRPEEWCGHMTDNHLFTQTQACTHTHAPARAPVLGDKMLLSTFGDKISCLIEREALETCSYPIRLASIVLVHTGTWWHWLLLTSKYSLDFKNREVEFKATFYPVARAIITLIKGKVFNRQGSPWDGWVRNTAGLEKFIHQLKFFIILSIHLLTTTVLWKPSGFEVVLELKFDATITS